MEREIFRAIYSIEEAATFVDPAFYIFIDKDLQEIVDELNAAGLTVDEDILAKHIKDFEKQEKALTQAFKNSVNRRGYDVKINSRKDLTHWFFEVLELPVIKRGKTGPSMDNEVLEMLSDKDESVKLYADAKKAHSMLTTLLNIQKALRSGKIYPQHNLNKAASGRFSSSGSQGDKLNINGWPKSIRDILKPAENTVIVSFDYKNMEGAVQASMAKETSLLSDYSNSVDLHQKLADILGVDRQVAKIVNHGVSYGMTAFGLARKIGCSEEEAEEFIRLYWDQRPKIKNLRRDVINTARSMGYVATISDFRRETKQLTDDQIWSTFVQGCAADLFKEALAKVSKYLKVSGYGKIKTPMHDALICELNSDTLDEAIERIKSIMEKIHPEFSLKVEVEVGKW